MFQQGHFQPGNRGFTRRRAESRYHEDRLIVKMRASFHQVVRAARSMAASARPAFLESSPGLGMLNRFDRAGLIQRVTPIGAAAAEATAPPMPVPRRGALAAFGAPLAAPTAAAGAGLCIVQSSETADLEQLQLALADDPNVEFVGRLPVRYLTAKKKATKRKPAASKRSRTKRAGGATIAATPPSPLVMWNLQKVRWEQARAAGLSDASSIRVGVMDTGIEPDHPDLPTERIDYVYDYGIPGMSVSDQDFVGHGTHVAGTICARINGETGVHGVCDCMLTAYKIFADELEFTGYDQGYEVYQSVVDPAMYLEALTRCIVDGVRVVNLSIGGYSDPSPAELSLFQDLFDRDVVVVAAMGNDDTHDMSYPAAIEGVIAVGATDRTDRRARFSNKGPHIDLCAPGKDIWSTLPTYPGETARYRNPSTGEVFPAVRETDYDAWQGTSMAAPHVAAAAALLLHRDETLTPGDIRDLLNGNADKVPRMGGRDFDQFFGHGRLNLERLAAV